MATGNVVPLQRPVDPVEALRKIGEAAGGLAVAADGVAREVRAYWAQTEYGTRENGITALLDTLSTCVAAFAGQVQDAVQGVQ